MDTENHLDNEKSLSVDVDELADDPAHPFFGIANHNLLEEFDELNSLLPWEIDQLNSLSPWKIKAALMGDMQEGLRLAMCQYGRLMHKVAYDVLRNYAVAQDAVSMAWYKFSCAVCSERFATFEAEQLIPFLCLITRREAFTLYRREQKQRLRVYRKRDALFEEQRRNTDTPDDIIERNERDQLIRDALEQLQPHIRTALRLRYFFDEEVMQGTALSNIESERYEQLAAATGRKAVTLRSHVNRGLKRLEKLLKQRGINSY